MVHVLCRPRGRSVNGSCLDYSRQLSNSDMDLPIPTKRDRTGDNFSRATTRMLKRCHQISRRYDADVYVFVRRKHRTYDYNSTDDPRFPASVDMVRRLPTESSDILNIGAG